MDENNGEKSSIWVVKKHTFSSSASESPSEASLNSSSSFHLGAAPFFTVGTTFCIKDSNDMSQHIPVISSQHSMYLDK